MPIPEGLDRWLLVSPVWSERMTYRERVLKELRKAKSGGYLVTINPDNNFFYYESVTITVAVSDLNEPDANTISLEDSIE